MRVRDKYIKVFGQIKSLAEPISWSAGVSNMFEWLTWDTKHILGVSKTQYRKGVLEISDDEEIRNASIKKKQQFVTDHLNSTIVANEKSERYDKPSSSVASPREALRRAKYFSEDYLNKEFDIFWALVSDKYLDAYYGQFTEIRGEGQWFCHGNGNLFVYSTDIEVMQIDNLSYSVKEGLLVANELKLGGKKNRDQILKYSLMYRLLLQRGFIAPRTRFMLLFIGDRSEAYEWQSLIQQEIAYCQDSNKSSSKDALHPECISIAKTAEYVATTWGDLIAFNERYIARLDRASQQVEQKLLWGFNESLSGKALITRAEI